MSKLKIDTREEFIIGEGISHQKIIKILAEAVIGFIVSSVRVFGFYPFGQAFAASATPAGLLAQFSDLFFMPMTRFAMLQGLPPFI